MTVNSFIKDEEEPDEDEEYSFEIAEQQRIAAAVEAPLSAYARHLARLDIVNPIQADILRTQYPVTKLVKAEIMYSRKTWKNRIWMTNGSPGTFKSFTGMTLSSWLDENGFWTHNKGNYSLPKLFFETTSLMSYLQSDARKGDCLMLDEEIDKSGMGVRGLQYAMHNIERTLRFTEINFMFVYVVERHHQVNSVFYTRGEHYVIPPFGDYAVLGVLQPLVTQSEYQLLGLMTVDVPSQKIVDTYHKRKIEFVGGMQKSAGFGMPADILRDYAWLLSALAKDEKFLALPSNRRAGYVSYIYHVQENVVQLLLSLVDLG